MTSAPWPRGLTRVRLDNGLAVILQAHAGADVAAVQLWFGVGARHEGESEAGLSHFIEHLLFKGTPTRGPGVIDETVSGLGGEMNAATSQDFTYYHVVLPWAHRLAALDLLADAARHAAFEAEELERERQVVLEEIRRAEDNPSSCLWRVLSQEHFPGHPYGRPVLGTPESIRTAPRQRILDYFRRHYTPGNAAVVVTGPLDETRALAEVVGAFGGWAPGAAPVAPIAPVAQVASTGALPARRRVDEVRPLQQTHVGLAWHGPRVPDADVYATDLLVSVLGQGRSSRLTQSLRERLGLVSGVGASFYPQHDAGTIAVTARTTPARRVEVEAAVVAEIEQLRDALIEPDELERAGTAVEAAHAFSRETAEGVAYAYGAAETVWTLDFELGYLDEARRVTRERIREAARRYLDPERFTAVTLGPADGQP